MTLNLPDWTFRREVRLTATIAVLLVLAWISFHFRIRLVGGAMLLAAIGIAVGYFTMVMRPARLPRGGLLTIRLEGAPREHSFQTPLQRLMARRLPNLDQARVST